MADTSSARLAYANIFARDIDALSQFYSRLLGFPEMVAHRSPIYRCLDAGGIELGFNGARAYQLLGLSDRQATGTDGVSVYLSFEVTGPEAVDHLAASVETLGGRVVKKPFDTYYNARQVVLEDPEGNIFRINHRKGPRVPADDIDNPPWR